MIKFNPVVDALLGVVVGDALGVPFEFKRRADIDKSEINTMKAYGTYSQEAGTWSDDSSLTLCLAESLINGYDLKDMATKFIAWKEESYWTARGNVFDIGWTTSKSITRLKGILRDKKYDDLEFLKYSGDEQDNGNGSLMRIIPLLFFIKGKSIEEQFEIIRNVSALTHRHIRAAMCCLIYLRMGEHILIGKNKEDAYAEVRSEIMSFWEKIDFAESEQQLFSRLIQSDIREVALLDLRSGGYVMESIEASIWCFLQFDNYEDTVVEAVYLGHDTDTTAAITGGLAGLYYGADNIPEHWIIAIARMEDIIDLGNRLHEKYN